MRSTLLGLLSTSLLVSLLSLLLLGCGSSTPRDEDDDIDLDAIAARKAGRKRSTGPAVTLKPVTGKGFGVIKGRVKWEGGDRNLAAATASLRDAMSKNTDAKYCLTGVSPDGKQSMLQSCESEQQKFRIGTNGLLGNVFVWIQPEPGHFFEIPPEQLAKFENTSVTMSQPHCTFMPHCVVLFPKYRSADGSLKPTGQQLIIENDARVGHNAKVKGGPANPEQGQLIQAMQPDGTISKLTLVLNPDPQPITVACNIHGWMMAYIRAFDHPYAALTSVGADLKAKKWEDLSKPEVGTFEITGVPVGAKVRFFAWHEELGYLGDPKGTPMELQAENVIPDIIAK